MSNGVSKFISMKNNRVLFISYDGMTDPLGQSQVLPYLTHLVQLNYEIHILSTEKNENFLNNKAIIEAMRSGDWVIIYKTTFSRIVTYQSR